MLKILIHDQPSIISNFQKNAPNFNRLVGGQMQYARDVVQMARVNQLDIPFFKAKDCIFIRDSQPGNYQYYFVSLKLQSRVLNSHFRSTVHTT